MTAEVQEEVKAWQQRPLEKVYPIVYLDGLVVQVRTDGRVANRTIYLAIAVNLQGKKEVLGLWAAQTEGARVLARRDDGVEESGRGRFSHRLCGWLERLSRGD